MSAFSSSPQHLPINAALLDEAVHSDERTFVDRLGRTRRTIKGIELSVSDALTARDEAVLARDAAVAAAGPLYATIEEGRAAVADGETFAVVGVGDVAATIYRRVSASVSASQTQIPSTTAVLSAQKEALKSKLLLDFYTTATLAVPAKIVIDGDCDMQEVNPEPSFFLLDFWRASSENTNSFRVDADWVIFKDSSEPSFYLDFYRVATLEGIATSLRIDDYGNIDEVGAQINIGASEFTGDAINASLNSVKVSPDLSDSLYHVSAIPYDDLIAKYDALISESGGLLTKTWVGEDSAGNQVYSYDLKMPTKSVGGGGHIYMPLAKTMLLVAGVHGGEKPGAVALYLFFRRLVAEYFKSDVHARLRFGLNFRCIPVATPYGYIVGSRVNANGVDVNRNFSADWSTGGSTDPSSPNYRGLAPFSEPESQYLKVLVDSSEITHVIDSHSHGQPEMFWYGTNNSQCMAKMVDAAVDVSAWAAANIGIRNGVNLIYYAASSGGTFMKYVQSIGKPHALHEAPSLTHPMYGNITTMQKRRVNEISIQNVIEKISQL